MPAAAAEAQQLREKLGIRGELVVCVGRLVPRKGQDRLIDALALLTAEFPDLHLALIGEGRLTTTLYDRAQKRGVGERVHLTGALADATVKDWLKAADIFASPCRSRWGGFEVEGFGLVFAEAALCGLPVIAGRSGGAPESVREGDRAWSYNGRSAQQVAAWLASMLRMAPSAAARWAPKAASSHSPGTRPRWWVSVTTSCCGGRPADEPGHTPRASSRAAMPSRSPRRLRSTPCRRSPAWRPRAPPRRHDC